MIIVNRHIKQSLQLLLLLFALNTAFKLSGCKEPDPIDPPDMPQKATLHLSFDFLNGSSPIAYQEAFTDVRGMQHKLSTFKLYLSDIVLVKTDGSTYNLSDVLLIDYKPVNPDLINPQWDKQYEFDVPIGDYQEIRFGLGVPPDLNEEDPTTFSNDHPLSVFASTYWNWASMYRFIILETASDTGSGSFDHDILIHTGLDELYYTKSIDFEPVSLEANKPMHLSLSLDWNKLWWNSDDEIDLKTDHITHTTDTPEDFELAKRFTLNFLNNIEAEMQQE
jgi:hypothetical protein